MKDTLVSGPLTGDAAIGALSIIDHLTELFSVTAAESYATSTILLLLQCTRKDPELIAQEAVEAFDAAIAAEVD